MVYKNVDELLRDVIREIEISANHLSLVAAKAGEAALKERIFNEGKATDGSQIGQYDTKASSFGRSAFAVKSKFKPAAGRNSMYISNGYAGLRRLNGRQANYVDLSYTGSLMRSIVTRASGAVYSVVIQDAGEVEIASHNEARFAKRIFDVSISDIDDMEVAINLEMDIIMAKFNT